MAASILYGFSLGLLALLLGALSINLAFARDLGRPQFYPPLVFVGGLLLILLASGLMAALGVLVSLRAKTVRQAFQQLSVGLVLLFLIPTIGLQFAPAAWKASRNGLNRAIVSKCSRIQPSMLGPWEKQTTSRNGICQMEALTDG